MMVAGSFDQFSPGSVITTDGAAALKVDFDQYLKRHISGEWGDVSDEDAQANKMAIAMGDRGSFVMSSYVTSRGRIWIVTRLGDHTVIMLPSESIH